MSELENIKNAIKGLASKIDTLLALIQGTVGVNCRYTLHEWLDEWYTAYKAPSVKSSTLSALEVLIRVHIKPNLPNIPLNLVDGLTLQKYLSSIERGRTRKAVFDLLKEAFKTAHGLRLIAENPTLAVKIPPHTQERGTALDAQELADFLEVIRGHTLEKYFLFLLYSGCRRSEALTLRVEDIDRKNRLLHIRGTKTKTSLRTIPLFAPLSALLNTLTPDKDGFFFAYRPDYPTHAFKKICPSHKLHDLRHTFATRCLEAKIPLKVVQKWLGHSKMTTTADIYSHVTAEMDRAEATALDAYLTQKTT